MPATRGASGPGTKKFRSLSFACFAKVGKSSCDMPDTFWHFCTLMRVSQVQAQKARILPCRASIAWHHMDHFDQRRLCELPGKCMLTPAVAYKQNSQLACSHIKSSSGCDLSEKETAVNKITQSTSRSPLRKLTVCSSDMSRALVCSMRNLT